MYFEIDHKNEIRHNFKKYVEIELAGNSLIICGNFLCLFHNKKFLTEPDSIDLIKSSLTNLNDLQKNILNSIGDCQFILKRSNGEIIIYNSNESRGLFYTKERETLYVSSKETDIARKLSKTKFNNFELVDYLFRHFNKRNSFRSVIDGIMRLPTSYFLKIERNLTLSNECFATLNEYCTDKRSFKELDSEFKYYLEETISYLYEKNKDLKLYSDLSAGIDSTVVTIACKKKNLNVIAFHHDKDKWILDIVRKLALKIGVSIKVTNGDIGKSVDNWWSEYEDRNYKDMEDDLGIYPVDNASKTDFVMKNNFVKFGGAAMGQSYQIYPCVYPVFGMTPIIRLIMNIKKGFFTRLITTEFFIKFMSLPFFSAVCQKVFSVNGKLPKNQKEYLSYLAINGVDVSLPYFDKDLHLISDSFYNEYINYFTQYYLSKFISKSDYDNLNNGVKIDPRKIQQYARLISQNRGVFNNKSRISSLYSKSKQIEPAFVSSLNTFLSKLSIGWREIFFPKGLFFRYFKNELNFDYHKDFIPKTYYFKNIFFHTLLTPLRVFRRKVLKKNIFDDSINNKLLLNSSQFKKSYYDFLDIEKSLIIKNIENKNLKKVIVKKINDIKKGNVPIYLAFNFINLEIFLRKISK